VRVPELIDAREEDGILEVMCASKLRAARGTKQRERLHKMVGNRAEISL
jgi:hypothetical protein